MFRCFKTILGASVIVGVLLGLMIKTPLFFSVIVIVLGAIVIALMLRGLWVLREPYFFKIPGTIVIVLGISVIVGGVVGLMVFDLQ